MVLQKYNLYHKNGQSIGLHISPECVMTGRLNGILSDGSDIGDYFDTRRGGFDIAAVPLNEVIAKYGERFGLTHQRFMLSAHGFSMPRWGLAGARTWRFSEGDLSFPKVQEWVSQNDIGGILYLDVCNGGNCDVEAMNSLVFYADGKVSTDRLIDGTSRVKLYVPNVGVVTETNAESALEKLENLSVRVQTF